MKLYLEVTRDKYELPLVVTDSPSKLAKICGVRPNTVCSSCSLHQSGIYKRTRFVSVEVDDEETM